MEFIEDFYLGILEEEGKLVTDEVTPYVTMLEESPDGAFAIGHQFWA